MTLNDKYCDLIDNGYVYDNQLHADRCEKIADEFAIEFGQWMVSGVEFMDDTERGRVYYFKNKLYTTKELLKIFKKEKGL